MSKFGLRFQEQVAFGKYTVDFWIPEIETVVEADGIYGHLSKRDAQRDKELKDMGVKYVTHIKSSKPNEVEESLNHFFNALD